MLAGPTTDRPSRARPVADAPVAALVAAAEDLAKGWLLELVAAGPLDAAAALPFAELAREGPALCAAVARGLRDDAELARLAPGGDLAPLAARAGALAGARDAASAVAAIDALRRVLWEAALTELPRAPGTLVADLADRLAATSATVVAATLSPRSPAPAPPPTGEPATSPPGSPAPGASAPDLAGEPDRFADAGGAYDGAAAAAGEPDRFTDAGADRPPREPARAAGRLAAGGGAHDGAAAAAGEPDRLAAADADPGELADVADRFAGGAHDGAVGAADESHRFSAADTEPGAPLDATDRSAGGGADYGVAEEPAGSAEDAADEPPTELAGGRPSGGGRGRSWFGRRGRDVEQLAELTRAVAEARVRVADLRAERPAQIVRPPLGDESFGDGSPPRVADGDPRIHLAARTAEFVADGRPFAVLLVELDGVEALLAAERDDEIARAVDAAERALEDLARPGDAIRREAPGRLWLTLPGAGPAGARALALRAAAAVERAADHRGRPLTATVGVAVCPRDGTDADALAEHAEDDLLAAQAAGTHGGEPPAV